MLVEISVNWNPCRRTRVELVEGVEDGAQWPSGFWPLVRDSWLLQAGADGDISSCRKGAPDASAGFAIRGAEQAECHRTSCLRGTSDSRAAGARGLVVT